MGDTVLSVNGEEHGGWTEVSVTRSLEQFAHTFDMSFTERWAQDKEPIPIREGDGCIVKLDGKKVTDGYVDDASISYSAADHSMHVSGRSRTGYLVDCAAIHGSGKWRSKDIEQIANDLCSPFSITVRVLGDIGDVFPHFSIHDGETVYETIERACRQRGVLLTTNEKSELVLAKIGDFSTKTVIEYGVNVLRGSRSGSWRDRFSHYIVKGQAPGNDDSNEKTVSQPKHEVDDEAVTRYRPAIVNAEVGGLGNALEKRAIWERNIRAGRSLRLRYTLHGWTDDDGELWRPNTIVQVKDPLLQVDTRLLIVTVRQTKNVNDGTNTELELCDPKAMTVEPLTPQPRGRHAKEVYVEGSTP